MMHTRSQIYAQRAYNAVAARRGPGEDKYVSFARSFPTLIHTCGLAQALAYAQAKEEHHRKVLEDVAYVLNKKTDDLLRDSRKEPVLVYIRLSRDALIAAGWVKRYAEAPLDTPSPSTPSPGAEHAASVPESVDRP